MLSTFLLKYLVYESIVTNINSSSKILKVLKLLQVLVNDFTTWTTPKLQNTNSKLETIVRKHSISKKSQFKNLEPNCIFSSNSATNKPIYQMGARFWVIFKSKIINFFKGFCITYKIKRVSYLLYLTLSSEKKLKQIKENMPC